MYDYLDLTRDYLKDLIDTELAATLGEDPDYSTKSIDYILVYESKFFDMNLENTTYIVFDMPPYDVEIPNIGFYCLRRNIKIDCAIYTTEHAFALWLMGKIEEVLVKDEKGNKNPFGNVDWCKPKTVSMKYDENYKIFTPMYSLQLFVSHDTL